ncbi:MAG: methyl-accepting chemotaxis protein, partial [Flavobacteriales bacterium]
MITVALLSLNMASNEIRNQAFNQLEAVREIKASAIKRYFSTVESQLVTMANTPSVIQAMNSFPEAFANALSEENLSDGQLGQYKEELRSYYGSE